MSGGCGRIGIAGGYGVDEVESEAGLGHLKVRGVVSCVLRDELRDMVVEGVGEVRVVVVEREVGGHDEQSVRHGWFGRMSNKEGPDVGFIDLRLGGIGYISVPIGSLS
jgi:hypothetical protein